MNSLVWGIAKTTGTAAVWYGRRNPTPVRYRVRGRDPYLLLPEGIRSLLFVSTAVPVPVPRDTRVPYARGGYTRGGQAERTGRGAEGARDPLPSRVLLQARRTVRCCRGLPSLVLRVVRCVRRLLVTLRRAVAPGCVGCGPRRRSVVG